MPVKKKPSPAQLAARAKFVAMVRAKSKAKKSATKKAAPKKAAIKKKVTGLDSVKRIKNKTQVNYSRMGAIETQLKRVINGRIYVCEFITADKHKADIKLKAYKEIGILSKIIKLSKDRKPVYGVFVQ